MTKINLYLFSVNYFDFTRFVNDTYLFFSLDNSNSNKQLIIIIIKK